MANFFNIIKILNQKERLKLSYLLIFIILMSFFDVIGIASIMPFMSVIINPELIENNTKLFWIYSQLQFNRKEDFLIFLGLLTFVLLISSLFCRAFAIYMQARFSFYLEHNLSKRLINIYLKKSYNWNLNQNSGDLSKTVLSDVNAVILGGIAPLLSLISQGIIVATLASLLFYINFKLAISTFFILIFTYLFVFKSVSNFIARIGKETLKLNSQRYKIVSEVLGAFKEIRVLGLEERYLKKFTEPSKLYLKHKATVQITSQIPRYVIEALAFGGAILLVLILLKKEDNLIKILPTIALYVLAGYRLIPSIQLLYHSFTKLKFTSPTTDHLHSIFISTNDEKMNMNDKRNYLLEKNFLNFKKEIKLSNIKFSYPRSVKTTIENVSLKIPVNKITGIVGVTGSGKSTLIDILLGLLEPEKGSLSVDDVNINLNNVNLWKKFIGYVPQQIYLADDSVSANIAFGCDPLDIDSTKLKNASIVANIHDFIINELPNGYDSLIGERGALLSGGQRQRIGIARALYRNPKLLILDEATSALDNLTEKKVMKAISTLIQKVTIVIVAHRLSTIQNCDNIYFFEKGRIRAEGNYEKLFKDDNIFRNMSNVS